MTGEQFLRDVAEPAFLQLDAGAGIAVPVRPGLPVDPVDAYDGQTARVDPGTGRFDHPEILEVVIASVLGRERQADLPGGQVVSL